MVNDDSRTPPRRRTGLWFLGARGSVATTATLGALALARGHAPTTGLVSELPDVARAGLVGVDELVVGGHDVAGSIVERAHELAASGVVPAATVAALADDLATVDARVRPGASGTADRATADRLQADIEAFRAEHDLERVVVVDVSSTEPPAPDAHALTLTELERRLDDGTAPLPASSLYAYAAFRAGSPVVCFTPSTGPRIPALEELAKTLHLPWAGRDGKTGETLLKATLAPMFATRALAVRSWSAFNILGGGDGRTLADPAAAASKTATKAMTVEAVLGYPVEGPVRIDHVADLGDWKTAWDHVTFDGFLGTRMRMQVTWEGCDSALAAPLVLDLARLVARAHEVGVTGPVGELGFFFKDPVGSAEHALAAQWQTLTRWCAGLGDAARADGHAGVAPHGAA
ncbi:myo-inositol-1-phosphate synthase [Isoptericola jiangsuensis]|uniref:Myo-inositol-1-phosphate synthase n=1 Tax=Isoptericola jiangsuensis TaxID=548579 RepID=A0A2A9ES71_9MICO|nr:inositol-3-phosphate synthase [Isoptericola jiangsuensis]PFG41603.1 myo-inositol-1-phosphate synthase [Isoptericola jiangsuensis]